MALVEYLYYRAVVMYLGRVVEILSADKISAAHIHPYTKTLVDSVFVTDPAVCKKTVPIKGEVPLPFNLPVGCAFERRCRLRPTTASAVALSKL